MRPPLIGTTDRVMRTLKKDQPIFYVYEHWRPDTNECFLVGKGHGRRAYTLAKRNVRHRHIVGYLRKNGLEPEVRIIFEGMTESEALALEIAWIALWRSQGQAVANITDGGEGTSGLRHSDETRAIIKAKRATQVMHPCSPKTREKIAAAQRGVKRGPNPNISAWMKGRKLTDEHKRRIGESGRGRVDSPEVREKRAASLRGKKASDTTRLLLSLAHRGHIQSAETRAKRSASLRAAWAKRKAAQDG